MKKILLAIVIVVLCVGGWCWYSYQTGKSIQVSNHWQAATIGDIPAPRGYDRIAAPVGSYAAYLRSLPLKQRGAKVNLYTGGEARLQFLSAAVIDQDLLSNSEQCADVTIRLRAEYLYRQGRYKEISFTDVNGKRRRYTGGASRQAFERYLKQLYGCCSTYSVYHETKPRAIKDVQPGDVLVYPARKGRQYGHALLVADVAKNNKGEVAIMCVEGNTPAREKHVVRNAQPWKNPWFFPDEDEEHILISCFTFHQNELRCYPSV